MPKGVTNNPAGRRRLSPGEHRQDLETTVAPRTLVWLEEAAARSGDRGLGRVLDKVIDYVVALREL